LLSLEPILSKLVLTRSCFVVFSLGWDLPNLSNHSRTLYITTYYAEDAIELSPNHLPSRFTHELVRGVATGKVRCSPYEMLLPAKPTGTSFFAQQEGAG